MALPAALETIRNRLKTFYNGNVYDPQQNPGGFARGGNQAGNFIASMRDVADFGKGVAGEFDKSLAATELQLSESRALAMRYERAISAIEAGPVSSVQYGDGPAQVGAVFIPETPLIFPFSITSPKDGDFLGSSNYTFEAEPFLSLYGVAQASTRVRFYALANPKTVIDSVEILGSGNTVPVNLGDTVLTKDTTYLVDMVYVDETNEERVSENKVRFTTPVNYEYEKYLAVGYKNHPYLTIYGQDVDAFDGLSAPSIIPPNDVQATAFSADGTYLAVAHSTSPYLTIYKRSGDTFTKLADPSILPTNIGRSVAFSADGVYLAVAHSLSPHLTIYKRSGDTFTKLADPLSLPTGNGYAVAFSSSGTYLAIAYVTSPYLTIYKRSGDIFTKLADPSILPAGEGRSVAFSADGVYLAVAHRNNPSLTIYKRSGDTFTKLADPAVLPAGDSFSVAFSANGSYLAVAHVGSPYLTIYKRSGDTFTKLADPAVLPASTSLAIAFSADDTYLAVAHIGSPYLTIYKRSGDTFTKLADPSILPASTGYAVAFYPPALYGEATS